MRTDEQTDMARSTLINDSDQEYVNLMGLGTFPSNFYILSDESSIPFHSTSKKYFRAEKEVRASDKCVFWKSVDKKVKSSASRLTLNRKT